MFLSLRSKNLNAKIKEINVLLHFSQMFNLRPHGYTAYIETVFHFLPNSNKHIGIDGYQGLFGMVRWSGGCFENSVRNLHFHKLFLSNSKTQNASSFTKRHFNQIRGKLMEIIFYAKS